VGHCLARSGERIFAEVLEMTVEEAMEFFKNITGLYEKMKTLKEIKKL
jgi:excinuclease UvrABC ATPase subunit